jgi:putative RNA 2'-phosphotransferase
MSKFLSLVLRHHPEQIGLLLDGEGWADVEDLLNRARAAGVPLTREVLDDVVRENDKQRFALDVENGRIRANQGHSIEVDPRLAALTPPALLYHGTARRSLESIRRSGLRAGGAAGTSTPSATPETARTVGSRHGVPVVLTVESGRMARDGLRLLPVGERGVADRSGGRQLPGLSTRRLTAGHGDAAHTSSGRNVGSTTNGQVARPPRCPIGHDQLPFRPPGHVHTDG